MDKGMYRIIERKRKESLRLWRNYQKGRRCKNSKRMEHFQAAWKTYFKN